MTATFIMEARSEAWQRALAACYRGGRHEPPEYYYNEPYPDCPPDYELDDECEYDEDGAEHIINCPTTTMTNEEIKQKLILMRDMLEDASTRVNDLLNETEAEYVDDVEKILSISNLICGAVRIATNCQYNIES